MSDYYEILGVEKNADQQEIKKAFRKLSLQHHPDRNDAPESEDIFKRINEAHETLSDPEKRQQYDSQQQGMPFMHMHPGGGGVHQEFHDINNIFRQFFGGGGGGMGGGMGGGRMGGVTFSMGGPAGQEFHFFNNGDGHIPGFPGFFHNLQKPPPIIKNLTLTLEQAYSGGNFPITIEKWNSTGNMKNIEIETIQITIPPGIDENEVIIMRDAGNRVENSLCGDVKIMVQITNDTIFQRQGMDLVCNRTITLKEALCGFIFELRHLNNKILSFNNHTNITVIKPGYKKVVPNLGMMKNGESGNLIINFDIVFPDILSEEQIKHLATIL